MNEITLSTKAIYVVKEDIAEIADQMRETALIALTLESGGFIAININHIVTIQSYEK